MTCAKQEATRLDTPPVSPGNPAANHACEFFFDLSPTADESKADGEKPVPTNASNALPASAQSHSVRNNGPGGNAAGLQDWREAKTKHASWSRAIAARATRTNQSHFELNMVEHLPNSPLCPRSPKHKSGGTGICVYHGRNGKLKTAERALVSATEESIGYS